MYICCHYNLRMMRLFFRATPLVLFLFCFLGKVGAAAYTVGVAQTYASLNAAIAAINAGTITGSITLNIMTSIAEPAVSTLNASGTGAASYSSILIQPQGGGAWTISRAAANPMLTLKGVNITIDGLNTGGNSLILDNTSANNTNVVTTITFDGGANNCLVQNCTIKGRGRWGFQAAPYRGTIYFTATSNHDITVTRCTIAASAGGTPYDAIYSARTNYNITVSYCDISDWDRGTTNPQRHSFAINMDNQATGTIGSGGNKSWVIDNNKFTQSAARTITGGGGFASGAIRCANSAAFSSTYGVDITNNVIGHTATVGTMDMDFTYATAGAYTGGAPNIIPFLPIYVTDPLSGATINIQGNTIAGIKWTTSGDGFACNPGTFSAIFVDNPANESDNTVTPTINIGGSTGRSQGNIIGKAGYPITIIDNSGGAGIYIFGICTSVYGTTNIQNNTVSNFSCTINTAGLARIIGIALGDCTGPVPIGYCTGNYIYALDFSAAAGTQYIWPLYIISSNAATGWTIANNMISIIPTYAASEIQGILDWPGAQSGAIDKFYFNSVYIGGVGGTGKVHAFTSLSASGMSEKLTIENNIFVMDRATTAVKHIMYHSSAMNPTCCGEVLVSNYNIYINTQDVNKIGTITEGDNYTYAQWQTKTVGDANSYANIPLNFFTAPATGDLHITWDMSVTYPGLGLAVAGVYPLGQDIDIQSRANPGPDIGADEFGPLTPVEMLSFTGVSDDNNVKLIWETASETNNDYFRIERSEDGQLFEGIGTVNGSGNSSVIKNYEFTDYENFPGSSDILYYRLRQVDYDGKYEFHGPVMVKMEQPAGLEFYPESTFVNEVLKGTLVTSVQQEVLLEVMDAQGRYIYSEGLSVERGSNYIMFDLRKVKPGVYIIRAGNSRGWVKKKVIRY